MAAVLCFASGDWGYMFFILISNVFLEVTSLVLILVCVYFRRGTIGTAFIVCYVLTSIVSGYVSGGMYSRNGGMFSSS